jgi:hypothetical protein
MVDCSNGTGIFNSEISLCPPVFCNLTGSWSEWSGYSICKKKCGFDESISSRYCFYNLTILYEKDGAYFKQKCDGPHRITRNCDKISCLNYFGIKFLVGILISSLILVPLFFAYLLPLYQRKSKLVDDLNEKLEVYKLDVDTADDLVKTEKELVRDKLQKKTLPGRRVKITAIF